MRAGLVRAEGQVVTTAASSDRLVIQKLDTNSGQFEPREITVGNLLTGGSTGLTDGSVVFASATGDLEGDATNFKYTNSTDTLLIKNVDVGASGLVGSLDIFPATASKGKIAIAATANTNNDTLSITNAAHGQATTLTIPDGGAATANFVLSEGTATINGAKTFTSDVKGTTSNFVAATAGKGLQIKEGSNARMGTATLTSGTVTVSNTSVTASTRIFLSRYAPGASTALGVISVGTVVGSTSFIINSLKTADATVETNDVSVVHWVLIEPAA